MGVFVSFFPHLVAGPIMRAAHLLPQVEQERRFSASDARDATHAARLGLLQEARHRGQRRRDRQQGVRPAVAGVRGALGRRVRVRDPDLRRLLRLHRHRARHRPLARVRPGPQLRSPVPGVRPGRLLAALEHLADHLVPRLRLPAAQLRALAAHRPRPVARRARRHLDLRDRHDGHLPAVRAVARGQLELRPLGRLPRRAAGPRARARATPPAPAPAEGRAGSAPCASPACSR